MNLEARIDNIGKKPKVARRKKKGDDDVDVSVSLCAGRVGPTDSSRSSTLTTTRSVSG